MTCYKVIPKVVIKEMFFLLISAILVDQRKLTRRLGYITEGNIFSQVKVSTICSIPWLQRFFFFLGGGVEIFSTICKIDSCEKHCLARHSRSTFLAADFAVDSIYSFDVILEEKVRSRRSKEN